MSKSKSSRTKSLKQESFPAANSAEETIGLTTQKNELPGVDYKNKLGPRSSRNIRLDLSTKEGEARYLSCVTKELSKKANLHRLQTTFQQPGLAQKTIYTTNEDISAKLSSPLQGVADAWYIQKHKNEELVQELPRNHDEDDASTSPEKQTRPSVTAVNLKWRNGIQVKQLHKFTTKTVQLEPVMRTTEFDYDSKTRFDALVESACEDLFPEWRQQLMILDGNDCHGQFTSSGESNNERMSKTAKSNNLLEDPSPTAANSQRDPTTKEWNELTDMEEHKILVIPFHSKSGFDTDLGKRYQFPYKAKFTVGRKTYQHRFSLQVPLSKSPQHFGLVFTFPEDPTGSSKLIIKSLLTVYSVFPVNSKHACLETYAAPGDDVSSLNAARKTRNANQRAAKNTVEILSENLKEEKLHKYGFDPSNSFDITSAISSPAYNKTRARNLRLNDDTLTGQKQKKKQSIQRNIRMEQARM